MIILPAIFATANKQSEKKGDVLVAIEDETLFGQKTTAADWGNNTSESGVDYAKQPGRVLLSELSLWIIDLITDKIYNVETKGGAAISSFATSVFDAAALSSTGISLASDGTLWITDNATNKVYNVQTDGTWISEFASPSGFPNGISYASDGTLWITDATTNRVYNVETDGTPISNFATSVFDASATSPNDISYATDDTLWITDNSTDKIYNIETDGTWISEFSISAFGATGASIRALSWASDNTLWTIDTTTREVYNISTNGGEISSFNESDFDGSAVASWGISANVYKYPASGNITTDNIDIGDIPTEPGEWALEDIIPDGCFLTYTAEYSTTGAWGGEEVSIGAITDGLAITVLARYWRVTATLTANTARNLSPILQAIKADYTTFKRFNKVKDLGYEALVMEIDSLTSKVSFFDPASIGTISVQIAMTKAVSIWVDSDTLFNKIVKVKLGYVYPGLSESDYIHYFTGAVDDWDVTDGILNLQLKDLSKDWKLPVPSKWETTADDVAYLNKHPTDIMLDIFQNEINIRDSGLLFDSFAEVKAATPDYRVTRTITKKTEDAKKLVEELRFLLWAFFLPRGDGKIGMKIFDKTEAIQITFTDDNTIGIEWEANSGSLINRTALYFDWDTLGGDEENFDELDEGEDTTSQTDFRAVVPFKLFDKWTQAAEASQISELETKILDQFDRMPSKVRITCDAKDIAYEAGDMVNVTTVNAPGSGGVGITDEKYLLTSKNLDFLGDKIVFEGLKVAV